MVRRVSFKYAFEVRVKVSKNQGSRESLLQVIKCAFASHISYKLHHLLGQVHEWSYNLRKVLDKSSIKVRKSKERSYIMHILWAFPAYDRFNFSWIHLDPFSGHNQAEIRHFACMELTFSNVAL